MISGRKPLAIRSPAIIPPPLPVVDEDLAKAVATVLRRGMEQQESHFFDSSAEPHSLVGVSETASIEDRAIRLLGVVEPQFEALKEVRLRLASPEGKRLYNKRAGVEGAISHGVRVFGLRRTRYRGLARAVATYSHCRGHQLATNCLLAYGRAARCHPHIPICCVGCSIMTSPTKSDMHGTLD